MNDFHFQGAVPVSSNAYIERDFEKRLRSNIMANRWVLLLGPRQYGKSSSLIRLKLFLWEIPVYCAYVTMEKLPPIDNYEMLLIWFAKQVSIELKVPFVPTDEFQPNVSDCLRKVIPSGNEKVVIIIDEAAAIANDDWRNSFFGQIRSIANSSAEESGNDFEKRLVFIFSGTFRAESLVDPRNSPFNVCQIIEPEDFELDQVKILVSSIKGSSNFPVIDEIYKNIGGQPYLLQKTLSRVFEVDEAQQLGVFSEVLENLQAGDDYHFANIFSKVFSDLNLCNLLGRIVNESSIRNEPANHDLKYLNVLGVTKRVGTEIVFRNRVYAEVGRRSPQLRPDAVGGSVHACLFEPDEMFFDVVTDPNMKKVVRSFYNGAVKSYNARCYRLAVVGFGSALEGVLVNFLSSRSNLSAAVSSSKIARGRDRATFDPSENESNPMTWKLVNLIKVARCMLPNFNMDLGDKLRGWRNLIHPREAVLQFVEESELEPEARTAGGIFTALVREIVRIGP